MASFTEMVAGLRRTFGTGCTKTYEWRYKQLQGMLRLIDENKDRILQSLHEDLHKPKLEAMTTEVLFCRNDLIDTMNNLQEWMKPEKVKKTMLNVMDSCYVRREPYGVALVIGAWNYPIQLTLTPLYGALAAGNCVILKPSELSASTAKLLEEIIPKYLDNDCVKVVNGGVPETTALLKERFDYIMYTGNSMVGKIIMKAAAEYLTPVTLELGGKSPVYIDETSDMRVAARRILWGKCSNAGQICIAPDYVMCNNDLQDKLVQEMKNALAEYYPNGTTETEDYARIVNERHFQRVKKLIDGSEEKVALGGKTMEKEKYIEPTVITNCKPSDLVMQEEVFGPVLPIMPVKNEDEAIQFINNREKPLAMYVFTKNKTVSQKFLQNTSSGGYVLNDTLMHAGVMTLPFGGVGNSGMGAYHGYRTFDTFSHRRAVLEKKQSGEGLQGIRYPPYSQKKIDNISWITGKKQKKSTMSSVIPYFLFGVIIAALVKAYGVHTLLLKGWKFS